MAKLHIVKLPNIAAGLQDQNMLRRCYAQRDKQTKKEHKNSYFRFRIARCKAISTKLGMWIEDLRAIFPRTVGFGSESSFWARVPEVFAILLSEQP